MSDVETTEPERGRGHGMTEVLPLPRHTHAPRGGAPRPVAAGAQPQLPQWPHACLVSHVSFDHSELRAILDLYARMVARGEWRDYAIDFLKDKAVFSIFRRTADVPLYRIEKDPKLARRQGAYAVVAATGLILKRGHELPRVLRVLEKPLKLVAE
jgi:hypothetical protein